MHIHSYTHLGGLINEDNAEPELGEAGISSTDTSGANDISILQ